MGWEEDHQQHVRTMPTDIRKAHAHSIRHRREIIASALCGCFYCCRTFRPDEIREWVDDDADGVGQTALCPACGIDSVLGDRAGYELSQSFLRRMQALWFSSQ